MADGDALDAVPAPESLASTEVEAVAGQAWDWHAAERVAVAVAGGTSPDLDDAYAILIHLREKVPGSTALAGALARGVPVDRVWHDDRFLAAAWTIATNKLVDLRRAAMRRRAPRFRRPNGADPGGDPWVRYPPYFRIVPVDGTVRPDGEGHGTDVADIVALPDALVEGAEVATVSREVVLHALRGMRRSDAVILQFAYARYSPLEHGARIDEALGTHLTSIGPRPVSRDAARRRLADARTRLEDSIVGRFRHALLRTLADDVPATTRPPLRTALATYLSTVGRRPRAAAIEMARETAAASVHPAPMPWPDRAAFAKALMDALRALFARHESRWGEPFFGSRPAPPPVAGVPSP